MRQEDKELDGPDLEQAEERKRENELVEEREDELYDLDGREPAPMHERRSEEVHGAMRTILERGTLVINDLKLPRRHLEALEALKTAVEGRDQKLSRFVYAEDRRTLLEQALAVLQPELASLQDLGEPFQELIAQVGSLRERLDKLEDAEEELVEGRAKDAVVDESDSDDKPDDEGDDEGDDDDTSLDGPERPQKPKPPTSLGDPKEIAQAAVANAPRWKRGDGG